MGHHIVEKPGFCPVRPVPVHAPQLLSSIPGAVNLCGLMTRLDRRRLR